jgi:hypothetical protein
VTLSTSVDSTYADSGTDASVKQHQQDHDTIHAAVNAAAGGTTGQVWAKTSSADYAASWQTDACGGGDYYGSGGYAHGTFATGSNSSSSLSLNRLYVRPFWVATRRAFDRIAIQVSSAGTTGAVLRLGIYSPGGGTPGSLLLDAGTVASTSTGTKAATISQTLDPGIYWVAVVAQVAACGVVSFPATATPWAPHWTVAPPNGAQNPAKSMDSQSGALPSTFTLTGDEAIVPAIALRAT